MKLKVFTLRFSENADGFDDQPIQAFIADKEVIEYTEHFFVHEKTPYLTMIVSYREISADEKRKLSRKHDPRKELDDKEKKAYEALRTWRAAKANQEGIPPYMIASNKQIAGMIKTKAATKADLSRVKGVGEAKITKYGDDILKIISTHLTSGPIDQQDIKEKSEK